MGIDCIGYLVPVMVFAGKKLWRQPTTIELVDYTREKDGEGDFIDNKSQMIDVRASLL